MPDLRRTVTFAAGLYRSRLGFAYHGYVRRDPMSLLHLRPGRDDPYAIYRGMRITWPSPAASTTAWVSRWHGWRRRSRCRLAERLPDLRRAGPLRRRVSSIVRGPIRLPVRAGARELSSSR